jgi:hypothetical protein
MPLSRIRSFGRIHYASKSSEIFIRSSWLSAGFWKYARAPVMRARSLLTEGSRALITTTGTLLREGVSCNLFMTRKPSPPGIPMSRRIRSGSSFLCLCYSGDSVLRMHHFIVVGSKRHRRQAAQVLVVFDEQDTFLVHLNSPFRLFQGKYRHYREPVARPIKDRIPMVFLPLFRIRPF